MSANTDKSPITSRQAAALLDWYLAMGVDTAIGDAPVDRFAESARPEPQPRPAPNRPTAASAGSAAEIGRPAPPPQPQSGDLGDPSTAANVLAAREQAAAAQTLEELREALSRFDGCSLKNTAKNLVFADGNPEARIMFVGEAPGRDEDQQGLPFVGRAGQLLDRMLGAIGLDRSAVYIANVVPWRPPGNRKPTAAETEILRPFVERQIELCNPDILICLGATSLQQLIRTPEGILRLRGRWFDYPLGGRSIRLLATLHPAYLLRQPAQKRLSWRDFRALKRAIAELNPS